MFSRGLAYFLIVMLAFASHLPATCILTILEWAHMAGPRQEASNLSAPLHRSRLPTRQQHTENHNVAVRKQASNGMDGHRDRAADRNLVLTPGKVVASSGTTARLDSAAATPDYLRPTFVVDSNRLLAPPAASL